VFHRFEDRLRAKETSIKGRNDDLELLDTAEPKIDPFSPYSRDLSPIASPALSFNDPYDRQDSVSALPLVTNAQPLRQDSPDAFEEPPNLVPSALDSVSQLGTERYAPSRNMFRDIEDYKGEKDGLEDPVPGEVAEEYRESAARRRWVFLCMLLTWMIPGFLLNKIGGMKRQDIRQAWREKLAVS